MSNESGSQGVIRVNEVGSAVFGAYRLACRDPGGMAFFDRSREGAIKSFYAAGLLVPFYLFLIVTRWWEDLDRLSPAYVLTIEVLYLVIAWTAFPVLMIGICKWIDRENRLFDFIVAANWAHVLTVAVRFPVIFLQRFELLPEPIVELLILVVMTLVLVYMWYVKKTALDIGGGMAAALTGADFILGALIRDVSYAIIEGKL